MEFVSICHHNQVSQVQNKRIIPQRAFASMQITHWVPGAHLSVPPRSWCELALDDLQRGIRLIQKVYPASIDPQFHIATREGNYMISMARGQNQHDQQKCMELLKDFMAWKGASHLIVTEQTTKPASVMVTAVSADAALVLRSLIKLTPLDFLKPQLLPYTCLDKEFIALLPRMTRTFSPQRTRQFERWFGENGKYPAVFTKR